MIITAQKGRGKKLHILIDDEYFVTTDIDFWYDNFVPNGTEISDDDWEKLLHKINYRKAYNKAVDSLSRRDYSENELRQKLLKTADTKSVDKAIERMKEFGYIDDEKFAINYSKHLLEVKMFSVGRTKQELRRKGVDREIIDLVLSETEIDSVDQVVQLLQTKYSRKISDEVSKRRTINALMRLGYGYSDIKSGFYRIECEIDTNED